MVSRTRSCPLWISLGQPWFKCLRLPARQLRCVRVHQVGVIMSEASHDDFGELMAVDVREVWHVDHRDAAEVEGPDHRECGVVGHGCDRIGGKRFVVHRRIGVANTHARCLVSV